MHQTKLIGLLKVLDKGELIRFTHFLKSPFFFQGRQLADVQKLMQYLMRYHPTYDHPKIAKEKVFAKVFEGEAFQERRFKHLMTKANKALEQFITLTYRDPYFDRLPETLSWVTFYRRKKRSASFLKAHQKAVNVQAAQSQKDDVHFWVDYLLARELAEHDSMFNMRKTDVNLPQTLARLDYFFIVAKLEAACVLLSQKKHQIPLGTNGELDALKALMPLLQHGRYREEPLIDLLFQTYELLQSSEGTTHYKKLKACYNEKAMSIALNQRQIVHGVLRNFCTQQLNKGQKDYLAELFDLYQEGLAQGVLDSGGGLLPSTFQNLATLGIRLGKYDWVEQFLEAQRMRIIGMEEPESLYTLNRANLLFAKAQYEEALEYLTYNFADTYLKLIARRLEVQIYYELASPLLASKIQAFKIFVFRTAKIHLTPLQREGYTNFIDLLKQIIHPSTPHKPQRIKSLTAKLEGKETVAEKQWLLDKLKQVALKERF